MLVEVAVQNEGIWAGECTAGAHQAEGWFLPFLKLMEDGVLISQSEYLVHLLAIETRREPRKIGEGPSAGVVGAVTSVEFEAADAGVNQVLSVIVSEHPASRISGKIGY